MPCQACITRGKTWQGSDPKCAFENATFSADNWNCATVSLIRNLATRADLYPSRVHHVVCDSEEQYSAMDVSDVKMLDDALTLWVQWYKNRGRTQAMWLLFEKDPPRQPTEAECILIATHFDTIL